MNQLLNADEGTVEFWVRHDHADWMTNSNSYRFGPFSASWMSVQVEKHPDGMVDVSLSGVFGEDFGFRHPIPQGEALHIAISWEKPTVSLYFSGKLVKAATATGSS